MEGKEGWKEKIKKWQESGDLIPGKTVIGIEVIGLEGLIPGVFRAINESGELTLSVDPKDHDDEATFKDEEIADIDIVSPFLIVSLLNQAVTICKVISEARDLDELIPFLKVLEE